MDYSTYHHVIARETSAQFYILRFLNILSSQQLQTTALITGEPLCHLDHLWAGSDSEYNG
jgi:hypothetical protein